ncbi:MAG TPA: alpha-amylase family protein [Flavobacterium sp.]|uniref:alpha-amylase family protein n=1 Tax=unclassified Flavobacterium TaxID=196869 RepID=UPI0025C35B77|nr:MULTISPECIES: alpha-amylase family protein [unclassified Flavobacterium]HRE78708.1 alpha-amylase family protein [Flavobacterium sp.]
MLKKSAVALSTIVLFSTLSCEQKNMKAQTETVTESNSEHKIVVYQVFTRLFGNTNTTNKPWGTIEENGVGKFNDFTDKALQEIKDLGVTHIWYTGVPHHALINDYTKYDISNDDPDVVKGRAGSPYAVKDYYNVNPDLAVDPSKRLEEFEALIERTHKNGLKVVIDIVPNHIARKYEGKTNPKGVKDFGADDDKSVEYKRNNNFYYIPNSKFEVPTDANYKPLGGEKHPLADGKFEEVPAKWTGNGSRLAKPDINDWYETVKINYGVKPDGSKDFPTLPEGFDKKDYKAHADFWKGKDVPDSWKKFKDITHYWIDKGVDGFRYDMAEMVPVEFWSYMNSSIKVKNPNAFLLAEVYNPGEYRNYIHIGKMDYLYDKVQMYDTLKNIVQGRGLPKNISGIREDLKDIEHHMLHFLDNHDEQRLASPQFAGDAKKGKPLMVVSATISSSPTMIYFGQEVGEPGALDAGFGKNSRTSIFDYVGVPHHQRWMNDGKFDGGQLKPEEKELRDFYKRLLNFTLKSSALMGEFEQIHDANLNAGSNYDFGLYSYVRWSDDEKLVIVTNFNQNTPVQCEVMIPADVVKKMNLKDGKYKLKDQLYGKSSTELLIENGVGKFKLKIGVNESFIYKI